MVKGSKQYSEFSPLSPLKCPLYNRTIRFLAALEAQYWCKYLITTGRLKAKDLGMARVALSTMEEVPTRGPSCWVHSEVFYWSMAPTATWGERASGAGVRRQTSAPHRPFPNLSLWQVSRAPTSTIPMDMTLGLMIVCYFLQNAAHIESKTLEVYFMWPIRSLTLIPLTPRIPR